MEGAQPCSKEVVRLLSSGLSQERNDVTFETAVFQRAEVSVQEVGGSGPLLGWSGA